MFQMDVIAFRLNNQDVKCMTIELNFVHQKLWHYSDVAVADGEIFNVSSKEISWQLFSTCDS